MEERKRGKFGMFYAVVAKGYSHMLKQHPLEVYGVFDTKARARDYISSIESEAHLDVSEMPGFLEDGAEGRVILTEWIGAYEYNPYFNSEAYRETKIHQTIWDKLSPEERVYLKLLKPPTDDRCST